jgi:hypothetical protein
MPVGVIGGLGFASERIDACPCYALRARGVITAWADPSRAAGRGTCRVGWGYKDNNDIDLLRNRKGHKGFASA